MNSSGALPLLQPGAGPDALEALNDEEETAADVALSDDAPLEPEGDDDESVAEEPAADAPTDDGFPADEPADDGSAALVAEAAREAAEEDAMLVAATEEPTVLADDEPGRDALELVPDAPPPWHSPSTQASPARHSADALH